MSTAATAQGAAGARGGGPASAQDEALPPADAVRRIGCLMLNGIGDIVSVTPTLAALKARYPAACLTLMIRPHLRGLADGSADVDEVLPFAPGLRNRLRFVREARARRFDLWVDLHVPTFNTVSSNRRNFLRNALLMRAAAPRYRRAYAVPELARHLTHPLAMPDRAALCRANIVDTTLALAAPADARRYTKSVPVSAGDDAYAAARLPPYAGPTVGLFFGSRQAADLWPMPHVLAFVRLLAAELPEARLVLVGGAHERALAAGLARELPPALHARLVDCIDEASMGGTAALLARCAALVCTDSGPMHIADAVGTPMVALFSSKNYPAIWRPRYAPAEVLNHAVECGPCFRADCPYGNRCMALIDPAEALAALHRILGASATRTLPAAPVSAAPARKVDA